MVKCQINKEIYQLKIKKKEIDVHWPSSDLNFYDQLKKITTFTASPSQMHLIQRLYSAHAQNLNEREKETKSLWWEKVKNITIHRWQGRWFIQLAMLVPDVRGNVESSGFFMTNSSENNKKLAKVSRTLNLRSSLEGCISPISFQTKVKK